MDAILTPSGFFLNVYKPLNITSFDVIYKLRKILNIKKIGHAGTLDPMADGVMQIGAGNAAKLLDYLNSDKEYIAKIKFGYTSSTLDCEGEIIKSAPPAFNFEELKSVLKNFKGEITQTPPLFSAIKVNGKRLYSIARKNPDADIDIPERKITIYGYEIINFSDYELEIKLQVSKGSYIRSFARDVAKKLNTDAYLTGLTRTRAGDFKIENSVKIEDIDLKKDAIDPLCVLKMNKYALNLEEFNKIKHGCSFKLPVVLPEGEILLTFDNKLVSIGILSDNMIKVKKNFV